MAGMGIAGCTCGVSWLVPALHSLSGRGGGNLVAAYTVSAPTAAAMTDSHASSSDNAIAGSPSMCGIKRQEGAQGGCHARAQAWLPAATRSSPRAQPSPARPRCPARLRLEAVAVSGYCALSTCVRVLPTGLRCADSNCPTAEALEFWAPEAV